MRRAILLFIFSFYLVFDSHFIVASKNKPSESSKNANRDILIISSMNGDLTGIDITNGEILWKVENNPLLSQSISNIEFSKDGRTYRIVPSLEGDLYMLDTDAGDDSLRALPVTADSLFSAGFQLANDALIVGGKEQTVYSLDPFSGKILHDCTREGCGSKTNGDSPNVRPSTSNKDQTPNESQEEKLKSINSVLLVKRHSYVIRGIDINLSEKWNFSVAHDQLALLRSTHPPNKEESASNALAHIEWLFNVEHGSILALTGKNQPFIKVLWHQGVGSSLTAAWTLSVDSDGYAKLQQLSVLQGAASWQAWERGTPRLTTPSFNLPFEYRQRQASDYLQENSPWLPSADAHYSTSISQMHHTGSSCSTRRMLYLGEFEGQFYVKMESMHLLRNNQPAGSHHPDGSLSVRDEYQQYYRNQPISADDMSRVLVDDYEITSQRWRALPGQEAQDGLPSRSDNPANLLPPSRKATRSTALQPIFSRGLYEAPVEFPSSFDEVESYYGSGHPFLLDPRLFPLRFVTFVALMFVLVHVICKIWTRQGSELLLDAQSAQYGFPHQTDLEDSQFAQYDISDIHSLISDIHSLSLLGSKIPNDHSLEHSVKDNKSVSTAASSSSKSSLAGQSQVEIVNASCAALTTSPEEANNNYGLDHTMSAIETWHFQSRYESDYTHVKCLGRGGFGLVFQATNNLDRRDYAIKRICIRNNAVTKENLFREVRAMADLEHPGIVRYYMAWLESPPDGWQELRDRDLLSKEPQLHDLFSLGSDPLDPLASQSQAAPSSSSSNDSGNTNLSSSLNFSSAIPKKRINQSFDDFVVFTAGPLDASQCSPEREYSDEEEDACDPQLQRTYQKMKSTSSVFDTSCEIVFNRLEPNHSAEKAGKMGLHFNSVMEFPHDEAKSLPKRQYLYIQMQLCDNQSLKGWLTAHSMNNRPPKPQLFDMFAQMVDAVGYLHQRGLMHRDLKPSNILFDLQSRIRIADFGLVTSGGDIMPNHNNDCNLNLQRGKQHTNLVGTYLYMSPEQEKGREYDNKVDIFALGLILMELLIAFPTEAERYSVLTRVKQCKFPSNFSQEHLDEWPLLQKLLASKPHRRPSCEEILSDPLLKLAAATMRTNRIRSYSSSGAIPSD